MQWMRCITRWRRSSGRRGRSMAGELMRVAGRLKATLGFAQIGEILAQDPVQYLRRILEQCREIHDLIYAVYIQYSVETALAV